MKSKFSVIIIFLLSLFIFPGMSDISSIYDKKPDIPGSFEGVLKDSEKTKALDYLNRIRKLHGLKEVLYDKEGDVKTAKASLIMVANNTLTHTPSEKMKCWSKEGADGARSSNLAMNYYTDPGMMPESESFFDMWLKDTNVESLGHRRWLLDPFLKYVSFGRVDGKPLVASQYYVSASALLVVNNEQNDVTGMNNDFVAYPYGEYPSVLFDTEWYLSFSVIADKKSKWNNEKVSFKNANIDIRNDKKIKMTVKDKKDDNTGFGLSNVLMWKTSGLKENVRYDVTIAGVDIKGVKKDFFYSFTLSNKKY